MNSCWPIGGGDDVGDALEGRDTILSHYGRLEKANGGDPPGCELPDLLDEG